MQKFALDTIGLIDINSFILLLLSSSISFVFYFLASHLRDWIKNREEKKRVRKECLNFFQAFTLIENPKRAKILVKLVLTNFKREILSEKLEMVIAQDYYPEKKNIKKQTKGEFHEYKFENQNESKDTILPEREILKRFTLNTKTNQDFFIMSNKFENLSHRLENERWMLIIGLFPFLIWDKNKAKNKEFNFNNISTTNKEVLIEFLKYLENRYRKIKIIGSREKLVNDELIKKIRNFKKQPY